MERRTETELRVERVTRDREQVTGYLQKSPIRNALDIWNLKHDLSRYELYVCHVQGRVRGHLGIYYGEDAKYVTLGGTWRAAEALWHKLPEKAVLTAPPRLGEIVARRLKHDAVFANDIMLVKRGKERLNVQRPIKRLTRDHAVEYSTFGSSFNAPKGQMKWIRDRLKRSFVFGAFSERKLVSVASLVAWLPAVAVIMGVETKMEFRGRGFGSSVVSAAVREGLRRSESCSLFVRSSNSDAIRLYRRLGFRKVGKELWIDRGTGIVP